MAVILNVEADHLDFFKDLADIEHSFHAFADLVPQRGYIISNADDPGACEAVKGLSHPVFTFGIADPDADCTAHNVAFHDGCPTFDVVIRGETYAHVELHIAGRHNILNSLAAASAAYVLGIPGAPWRRVSPRSTARAAASSARVRSTARTCSTTMPTTPPSCTPCSPRRSPWAMSA